MEESGYIYEDGCNFIWGFGEVIFNRMTFGMKFQRCLVAPGEALSRWVEQCTSSAGGGSRLFKFKN